MIHVSVMICSLVSIASYVPMRPYVVHSPMRPYNLRTKGIRLEILKKWRNALVMSGLSANIDIQDGARLDIDFGGSRFERAFLDVKVFNPYASRIKRLLYLHAIP